MVTLLAKDITPCKTEIPKSIRFEITSNKIHDISADGTIIEQDTDRIFSAYPSDMIDEKDGDRVHDVIRQLVFKFKPNKLGDVIVYKNNAVFSRYLIELVIYDSKRDFNTSKTIIYYSLIDCIEKVRELGLSTLSMNVLGTRYGNIQYEEFFDILSDILIECKDDLSGVSRITFAPIKEENLLDLSDIFTSILKVSPIII